MKLAKAIFETMPFTRLFQLIATFYRSIAFASLLVTGICVYLFYQNGFSILTGLFWFKVSTMAVLYFLVNEYKQKEYYYYHNLGLSKKQLWIASLSFDFTFFILSLIIASHLK